MKITDASLIKAVDIFCQIEGHSRAQFIQTLMDLASDAAPDRISCAVPELKDSES